MVERKADASAPGRRQLVGPADGLARRRHGPRARDRSSAPCSSAANGTGFVLAGSVPPARGRGRGARGEVSDGRTGRGARPRQALRRDRRGRPRRPDRRARRRLRLPRPERRRQDDVAADAARADPPDRGLGAAVRPRPAGRRREGARRRRRLRRGAALLPVPLGAAQPRLLADYDEPRARSRIDEVLELVELRDRAKDRVGGYSHGMRQRLGIAASLLRAAAAAAARRADDRASTRPACATCASSCAGSPARG